MFDVVAIDAIVVRIEEVRQVPVWSATHNDCTSDEPCVGVHAQYNNIYYPHMIAEGYCGYNTMLCS